MVEELRLEKDKALSLSFLVSAIIITFINGPLTIIKELSPLKGSLKAIFGHHWVGHGILLLILFIIFSLTSYGYYSGKSVNESTFKRLTLLLTTAVFIMLFLILGFYIYEYQI